MHTFYSYSERHNVQGVHDTVQDQVEYRVLGSRLVFNCGFESNERWNNMVYKSWFGECPSVYMSTLRNEVDLAVNDLLHCGLAHTSEPLNDNGRLTMSVLVPGFSVPNLDTCNVCNCIRCHCKFIVNVFVQEAYSSTNWNQGNAYRPTLIATILGTLLQCLLSMAVG